MHQDKRHKSSNVLRVGCLLTFVLVSASAFLGGSILSTSGIGVVGKANESTKSPVGAWALPNGTVQQYRADGIGSATTRNGKVTYFEWRLDGDELALYWFSNPGSVGARMFRLERGLGLNGERGHDNFKIVAVTPGKLTLAIDDERRGPPPTWERGDQLELTAAASEEAKARTTSNEESE